MFFQDVPPDTSGYMILGYAIFFAVMAIYLISLFIRSRNLKQDLFMLENMKQESPLQVKAAASKGAPPKNTKAKTARPKKSPAKTKKKK